MRTSLILDDESRRAARELSQHYDCSISEAVRRSLVAHRAAVLGVTPEFRRQRTRALERLVELFEGSDPDEELRRLAGENEAF